MSATPNGLSDVITCGGCGKTAPRQHPELPHLTLISFLSCSTCKTRRHFAEMLWSSWWHGRSKDEARGKS